MRSPPRHRTCATRQLEHHVEAVLTKSISNTKHHADRDDDQTQRITAEPLAHGRVGAPARHDASDGRSVHDQRQRVGRPARTAVAIPSATAHQRPGAAFGERWTHAAASATGNPHTASRQAGSSGHPDGGVAGRIPATRPRTPRRPYRREKRVDVDPPVELASKRNCRDVVDVDRGRRRGPRSGRR